MATLQVLPHEGEQQQRSVRVLYCDLVNRIVNLPESEFWNLVSVRLNVPFLSITEKYKDREFWTEEYLIDELFLQLAGSKEIVNHNDKRVSVHKYYNQAFRLRHRIPVAKPAPEFIVNMSDLTVRLVAELKALSYDDNHDDKEKNKGDPNYVLRQAVGRIFENINARQYHLSIARKLKVRLDA